MASGPAKNEGISSPAAAASSQGKWTSLDEGPLSKALSAPIGTYEFGFSLPRRVVPVVHSRGPVAVVDSADMGSMDEGALAYERPHGSIASVGGAQAAHSPSETKGR